LIATEHDGNPAHSFGTDKADFYARLVGSDSDDGDDAALGK
jgi:hypothetical protein